MKYRDFILTLIAILLLLHLLIKVKSSDVVAGSGIQNVNISRIGGVAQYGKVIEVKSK